MNIAEIRKKARVGKSADEAHALHSHTTGEVSPTKDETCEAEMMPVQTARPVATLSVTPQSLVADRSMSKELLATGDDRLDELFSWIPQQDEFLPDGSTTRSADEKKVTVIARRWLAFSLGSENYALDISVIREILKPREITEIPRVPDFLLGIISLRGNIIPVFDLKRRLGLGVATIDQDSRIIVCQEGDRLAGLLIDRITQVTSIQEENIEPPPAIFSGRDRAMLDGVGRVQENVLILLNIANVLTIDANGL